MFYQHKDAAFLLIKYFFVLEKHHLGYSVIMIFLRRYDIAFAGSLHSK